MTATTPLTVRPFAVDVPQADLDDLRDRLARTRFAPAAPDDSWEYGTPQSYLRDMVQRWTTFDWRAVEERVNAYPGFVTEIDGQPLHFLHVRSAHADATPLLLAHTYPGSVLDFLDMVEPLVDPVAHGGRPQDAFHLVIPSMPGFGFSTPLVGAGWTMARVARTYDTLMRGLGYDSYGIHGSDGGAMVGRELAVLDPEGFRGAHVLQLFSFPSGAPGEMDGFGPKEYAALAHMQWFQSVGGYNAMNASRPQTVGAGLADSPVATLAYHELFESFGNGTSLVTPEQVLAQASLYWLTNTYATAARYHYAEQRSGVEPVVSTGRLGVAVFRDDFQTIRSLAERDNARIEHWTEHPRGGHYAALEVPLDVVADLRVFFG
ncbi:epoxide hydrolase family protein [Cellulomonas fimi]|uniref:Microsomal epoxide hydrolase n=1 Tax=Cellulomonas fimi (strain ATCC 484 / DSM 20113 / JCM 1341 / CCUG 24087 / LMG 16345 / NBRC 15513 / NCIMB 8980 / NCTC 7547 / NRS-133) TaxID=590998 RepID=F4H0L9_CELFA|nr:epoxide hydrolase [Cellulomonas fimi]AEE44992.1 Microsomal epoxide hydrolase [Cellulomonas fimi ATCC 484]NNH08973.1 epoxide hydrolase [Cellulomonas fimi]VEH27908.1 Epoxide hydrolase N terminus [Cellulomonas fimi]